MDNKVVVYRDWDNVPTIPVDVKKNAEQRLACVLLIDCSGSMSQDNQMEQVNIGLREFEQALKEDALASVRVVVSVIAFGTPNGVDVVQEWTDAIDFTAPQFTATGGTPMGAAVDLALDTLEAMTRHFRDNGIAQYKPWLFIFTDGQPTDDFHAAARRCADAVEKRKVIVWPITTQPQGAKELKEFVGPSGNVFAIKTANVRELFRWLSDSVKAGSAANPGERAQIEAPGRLIDVEL
ncbi:MAG TPA: VWA domain-containing protein [Steroidobacteraceae bacterium]|nr:VWA domain-containing protein [Steroidobacteraceae bacterium]